MPILIYIEISCMHNQRGKKTDEQFRVVDGSKFVITMLGISSFPPRL